MKIIYYILLFGFVLSFILYRLFPQVLPCTLVPLGDFVEIKEGVFVENPMLEAEGQKLIRNIAIATLRIRDFWGKNNGKATIIFCKNESTYLYLTKSDKGAAFSVGTPIHSWIILNKDANNVDVIAHEMCHDELMTELGWWKSKTKVPTWFDEGLALMFDYRFVASQDSLQRFYDYENELHLSAPKEITLDKISTKNGFFDSDENKVRGAYFLSGMVVSGKIAQYGKKNIFKTIEILKKEDKFEF